MVSYAKDTRSTRVPATKSKGTNMTFEEFIKQEYAKEPQKPNGMIGTWGWYLKKEREYKKLMSV